MRKSRWLTFRIKPWPAYTNPTTSWVKTQMRAIADYFEVEISECWKMSNMTQVAHVFVRETVCTCLCECPQVTGWSTTSHLWPLLSPPLLLLLYLCRFRYSLCSMPCALLCSILLCSILLCSILLYSILLYSALTLCSALSQEPARHVDHEADFEIPGTYSLYSASIEMERYR